MKLRGALQYGNPRRLASQLEGVIHDKDEVLREAPTTVPDIPYVGSSLPPGTPA